MGTPFPCFVHLRRPASAGRAPGRVRRFSIFNSFMMVIFLTGIVSLILMRTLRKDYAKYAREVQAPGELAACPLRRAALGMHRQRVCRAGGAPTLVPLLFSSGRPGAT